LGDVVEPPFGAYISYRSAFAGNLLFARWFLVAGILGMMVFIALAGLSFLALRTRTRWIVLLAHVSILMYWFFSSLLISFDI